MNSKLESLAACGPAVELELEPLATKFPGIELNSKLDLWLEPIDACWLFRRLVMKLELEPLAADFLGTEPTSKLDLKLDVLDLGLETATAWSLIGIFVIFNGDESLPGI